nr:MucR family transcriptional regulator [uncultured Sphingomonas sp.]
MSEQINTDPVELASDLTIAWLSNPNNRATMEDVSTFLRQMHADVIALAGQAAGINVAGDEAPSGEFTPAVSVRKSLASKDHIISMIDGKPYRTLRRHLSTHGLTPEEYRERYNLKPDYPMVAPTYSEQRRAMAHKIGLGAKGRAARNVAADTPAAKPARKPRARVAAAD